MLLWIGALLIVGAATWGGFEYGSQLDMRPKQIRQLKNALQILEAEIAYSQTPLHEAFSIIASQVPKPTSSLFENISCDLSVHAKGLQKAWISGIEKHAEETALGRNEIEILFQLGRTLGQHDLIQQKKHLLLASSHLERELEEARTAQERYSKMAKMLGFLCGLFILILFI